MSGQNIEIVKLQVRRGPESELPTLSVTVSNGKTVTTTYNYYANGNITSTVNALS